METNKFDKMLHQNNHTIVAALVHVFLEWILIFLLLLNSLFSNLITKFVEYSGLKPPCIWCSRVNFFDSEKHENSNILHDHHICEAHGAEISRLRLSESNNACNNCFSSTFSPARNENENELSFDDSQAEEDESVYITDMLLQNADYSDRFICIEMTDEDSSILKNRYRAQDQVDEKCTELCVTDSSKTEFNEDHGSNDEGTTISETEIENESLTIEQLKSTIEAQEKALNALYTELEEERKAAAISTDETMAMITKIQQEKAAIQMEALQYQRMMEEQSEYDQEALQLLNNLMIKKEKENQQLQKELEVYRNRVLGFEFIEKNVVVSGSCNSDDESLIDLDSKSEEGKDFDEQRVCIMERLKGLEALFNASDDDIVAKRLLSLFDEEFGGVEDVYSDEFSDRNLEEIRLVEGNEKGEESV